MIKDVWLIGIGTGSLAHVTQEGLQAMRDAAVILVPHKGSDKDDLAELRHALIAESGSRAQIIGFDYPVRDPDLPYQTRVSQWHDAIAAQWVAALQDVAVPGPVALLVWGDPSLYDSTLRIANRLSPVPNVRVVPGITAIQALTAAHAIPLNTVNGPVVITTGRQLRDTGWPTGATRVLVMLDGSCGFQTLNTSGLSIWWGAYLGMPEQILEHGPLPDVADRIIARRAQARADHGWIMDTYLLAKSDTIGD